MPLPTYLMSNFPSVRPSLNLQFDSQPTPADMTSHLASVGATFSRASIGTYTDANGLVAEATAGQARPNYSTAGVHEGLLIEESRTNFSQSSEDLDDSTRWSHLRITVTEEAIINPKGTARAFKVSETTDTNSHFLITETAYRTDVVNGDTYTQSIFVKKGDGASAPDIVQMVTHQSGFYQNFNISTGELASSGGIDSASIEAYGDWYRLSISYTATTDSATGGFVALAFTNNNPTATRLPSYVGDADANVYVWGAQFEKASFPTSYIPTIPTFTDRDSVATFLGSDGLIQTASVDVARSDTYVYVDDVLTEAGLLLEGSAENFITSSEDFSTSNWNATSGGSITINQIIAPDGKASADLLTGKAGGSDFDRVEQSLSLTSGNDVTFSLFVKQYESDDQVTIRLEGTSLGTAGTDTNSNYKFVFSTETLSKISGGTAKDTFVEDYGNGWYRIGITLDNATITRANIYPKFNSADASNVYIWGAQVEEGSQATSYFPTERSFDSRASTATYFDSNGVLQTASTNVARTDHKYIGGQWVEAGLLLEGQSVNEQAYSEDLDNASGYDFTNVSVAESSITTPANDTNSYLMTESAGTGSHYMNTDSNFRPSIASGETWTQSIFIKKGDGANAPNIIQLTHSSGSFGTSQYANFNILTGVVTDSAGGTAKIEDVSNGWYRCSWTATSTSSGVGVLIVAFTNDNPTATRLPNYTASSNSDVYLWGAQLEEQSQPTSYIPTTTASATRAEDVSSAKSSADRTRDADSYTTATKVRSADVCTIDGTAFTDFYNQDEGTFLVEVIRDSSVDTLGVIYQAGDGTLDNRIENFINAAGDLNNRYRVGGVINDPLPNPYTSFDQTIENKIAFSYNATDAKVFLNGSEVSSKTGSLGTPVVNQLAIGGSLASGLPPNAGIKRFIYFPRALTPDTQIEKLTQ